MEAMQAAESVPTLLRGAAVLGLHSKECRRLLIQARLQLKAADRAVQRMLRKPATACDMQGCYHEAARWHASSEGKRVKLCETHSATSALPQVVYKKGDADVRR